MTEFSETSQGALRVSETGDSMELEAPDGTRRPVIGYVVQNADGSIDLVPRRPSSFTVRQVRDFVATRECHVPGCLLQEGHPGPCCST